MADVFCVAVAALYAPLAAHVAVMVQVPFPVSIVTVAVAVVPLVDALLSEQVPGVVALITAVLVTFPVSFDDAVTWNIVPFTALLGAPVKLTTGATGGATEVLCAIVGAA